MSKDKELLKKLNKFQKSWEELSTLWTDLDDENSFLLEGKYPFDKCFDELGKEVLQWKEDVERNIGKKNGGTFTPLT